MTQIQSINQQWLKDNENKSKTAFEHMTAYNKSAEGIYRQFNAASKACDLWNKSHELAGLPVSDKVGAIGKNFGTVASALAIPALPGLVESAIEKANAVAKADSEKPGFIRKVTKAFKAVSDAICTYCVASLFFVKNPLTKRVLSITDITGNAADLGMNAEDYKLSRDLENQAAGAENVPEAAKAAITASKNFSLMKAVKNIVKIATGILGLTLFAAGAPLKIAVALLVVSVALEALQIATHFYKVTRPHSMIDHYKLQPLAVK